MKTSMEAFAALGKVTLSEFGAFFEGFSAEAFRFEMLPRYSVSSEQAFLSKYRQGDPCPDNFNIKWLESLSNARSLGKKFHRVRHVPRPLPNYFEFEYEWGYKRSVMAGEEIRFLPPDSDVDDLAQKVPVLSDFWLFDELHCFLMFYDQIGRFMGVGRVAEDDLHYYVEFAENLRTLSLPFENFSLTD